MAPGSELGARPALLVCPCAGLGGPFPGRVLDDGAAVEIERPELGRCRCPEPGARRALPVDHLRPGLEVHGTQNTRGAEHGPAHVMDPDIPDYMQ
jgi:hypothetical protein